MHLILKQLHIVDDISGAEPRAVPNEILGGFTFDVHTYNFLSVVYMYVLCLRKARRWRVVAQRISNGHRKRIRSFWRMGATLLCCERESV